MGEEAAAHAIIALEIADDRLDSSPEPEGPLDRFGQTTLHAGDIDSEALVLRGVMAAIDYKVSLSTFSFVTADWYRSYLNTGDDNPYRRQHFIFVSYLSFLGRVGSPRLRRSEPPSAAQIILYCVAFWVDLRLNDRC